MKRYPRGRCYSHTTTTEKRTAWNLYWRSRTRNGACIGRCIMLCLSGLFFHDRSSMKQVNVGKGCLCCPATPTGQGRVGQFFVSAKIYRGMRAVERDSYIAHPSRVRIGLRWDLDASVVDIEHDSSIASHTRTCRECMDSPNSNAISSL